MNDRQLDMVLGYLNEGVEINEIEFLSDFSFDDLIFENLNISKNSILEAIKFAITKFIEFIKNFIKYLLDKLINLIDKNLQTIIKLCKNVNITNESTLYNDRFSFCNIPKFDILMDATNVLIFGIANSYKDNDFKIYKKIVDGEIKRFSSFARERGEEDVELLSKANLKLHSEKYIKQSQKLKNKLKEYKRILEAAQKDAKKDLDQLINNNRMGLEVNDIIVRRYETLLKYDKDKLNNIEIFWKDLFKNIIRYQEIIIKNIKEIPKVKTN